MDEKSIMVPLDDVRAKYISEVIGNKSCKKILDHLAEEDSTVTDISQKLKMPLNTVDYNIKKLIKADLIEKVSYWWSVKGKKMPIYRVSNKKIIIYPKQRGIRSFLWVGALVVLSTVTFGQILKRGMIGERTLSENIENAPLFAEKAVDMLPPTTGTNFLNWISGINTLEWVLIGAWIAILLFFGIKIYNERRKRKQ
jgi:DNA-binding transcriptional ArsR family regulator